MHRAHKSLLYRYRSFTPPTSYLVFSIVAILLVDSKLIALLLPPPSRSRRFPRQRLTSPTSFLTFFTSSLSSLYNCDSLPPLQCLIRLLQQITKAKPTQTQIQKSYQLIPIRLKHHRVFSNILNQKTRHQNTYLLTRRFQRLKGHLHRVSLLLQNFKYTDPRRQEI